MKKPSAEAILERYKQSGHYDASRRTLLQNCEPKLDDLVHLLQQHDTQESILRKLMNLPVKIPEFDGLGIPGVAADIYATLASEQS